MNSNPWALLLVSSLFWNGCGRPRQIAGDSAPENEALEIVQIGNLTLTDKTLTLNYVISNPFADDIRVFQGTNADDFQRVPTKIIDGTVWLKFRFHIEMNPNVDAYPPTIGRYLRLSSGESCSGTLVLDLPIRGFEHELGENRKKYMQIVLYRGVLEVGYFGPTYNSFFEAVSQATKEKGIVGDMATRVPAAGWLSSNPYIVEELHDGEIREVTYIGEGWPSLETEESAKVVLTDVEIPCLIQGD